MPFWLDYRFLYQKGKYELYLYYVSSKNWELETCWGQRQLYVEGGRLESCARYNKKCHVHEKKYIHIYMIPLEIARFWLFRYNFQWDQKSIYYLFTLSNLELICFPHLSQSVLFVCTVFTCLFSVSRRPKVFQMK